MATKNGSRRFLWLGAMTAGPRAGMWSTPDTRKAVDLKPATRSVSCVRGLFAVHVESWRACDLAVDRRAADRVEIGELGDRVLTGAGEVQEASPASGRSQTPCAATPERRAALVRPARTSSVDLRRLAADGRTHSCALVSGDSWRGSGRPRLASHSARALSATTRFAASVGYRETRRHRWRRREAGGSGASVSSRRTPSCRPCS